MHFMTIKKFGRPYHIGSVGVDEIQEKIKKNNIRGKMQCKKNTHKLNELWLASLMKSLNATNLIRIKS